MSYPNYGAQIMIEHLCGSNGNACQAAYTAKIAELGRASPSPAQVPCIKKLHIALLRYGALGLEDKELLNNLVPNLPDRLLPTEIKLPQLTDAKLGVRSLRPGYVYVISKRKIYDEAGEETKQQWGLDGCFKVAHVDNIGQARKEPVTGVLPGRYRNGLAQDFGIYGQFITVSNPEEIVDLRILFKSSVLTSERLNTILLAEDEIAEEGQSPEEREKAKTRKELGQSLLNAIPKMDVPAILKASETIHTNYLPFKEIYKYWQELIAFANVRQTLNDVMHSNYTERPDHEMKKAQIDALLRNASSALMMGQYHPFLEQPSFNHPTFETMLEFLKRAYTNQSDAVVCGMVLHDPIAIVQELNDWRNQAWVKFNAEYLSQKGRDDYTNADRIAISSRLQEFEVQYPLYADIAEIAPQWHDYQKWKNAYKGLETNKLLCQLPDMSYEPGTDCSKEAPPSWEHDPILGSPSVNKTEEDFDREIAGSKNEAIRAWQALEDKIKTGGLFGKERHAQHQHVFGSQFKPRIDEERINAERQKHDDAWGKVYTAAENRFTDYKVWHDSDIFINGFDFFDPNEQGSSNAAYLEDGLAFAAEYGECVVGAGGTENGFELVFRQIVSRKRDEEESGLAMRALGFNQRRLVELFDQLDKIFPEEPTGAAYVPDEPLADLPAVLYEKLSTEGLELTAQELQQFGLSTEQQQTANTIKNIRIMARTMRQIFDIAGREAKSGMGPRIFVMIDWLHTGILGSQGLRNIDRGVRRRLRAIMVAHLNTFTLSDPRSASAIKNSLLPAYVRSYFGAPTQTMMRNMQELYEGVDEARHFSKVRLAGLFMVMEAIFFISRIQVAMDSSEDKAPMQQAQENAVALGSLFMLLAGITEISATYYATMIDRIAVSVAQVKRPIAMGMARSIHTHIVHRASTATLGMLGVTLMLIPQLLKNAGGAWEAFKARQWGLMSAYGIGIAGSSLLIGGGLVRTADSVSSLFRRMLLTNGAVLGWFESVNSGTSFVIKTFLEKSERQWLAQQVSGRAGAALVRTAGVLRFFASGWGMVFLIFVTVLIPYLIAYERSKTPLSFEDYMKENLYGKGATGKPRSLAEDGQAFMRMVRTVCGWVPPTFYQMEYLVERDYVREVLQGEVIDVQANEI